jgi:hypothetical protein
MTGAGSARHAEIEISERVRLGKRPMTARKCNRTIDRIIDLSPSYGFKFAIADDRLVFSEPGL